MVGVVQVTTATKDDTLPDIARRFNVGYEEIVRANPGVDPWLPGEGREIVVPTQFVLPNAPREGIVINVAAMRIFYFPPHKKGEPQVVYHASDRHRQGGLVARRKGSPRSCAARRIPSWRPCRRRCARSTARTARTCAAVIGPGPDNPLGQYEFYLRLAELPDPRHQQALRRRPALEPRLHAPVPGGHREVLRHGARSARRCAWSTSRIVFGWHDGQLYLQAYDVLEDDSRDWKKAQKKLLSKSLAPRLQKELKERGSRSTGSWWPR